MVHKQNSLLLPHQIVTPADINRLQRDLAGLADGLHQMTLRSPGQAFALPRSSRLLEELATVNKLNLLQPADRQSLQDFLTYLLQSAPVLHISFATDPSAAFRSQISLWLRTNIHPHVLLSIGLQPSIAAGCIVRTDNKQFDFSLRSRFAAQAALLRQKLEAVRPA